jgi:hypothetical protein
MLLGDAFDAFYRSFGGSAAFLRSDLLEEIASPHILTSQESHT